MENTNTKVSSTVKTMEDLSPMQASYPIAVVVSDLHFSTNPPVYRSLEKNWILTQIEYWKQVVQTARQYKVPIFIAGDLFHTWNVSPEIINALIKEMKYEYGIWAIPGQHDLPNHRYDLIHKSAYWTLVESKIIHNIEYDKPKYFDIKSTKFKLCGFPWGSNPKMNSEDNIFSIALIHDYCWNHGHSFPGCSKKKHYEEQIKTYKNYSILVFGDNHKGFITYNENTWVINCGAFSIRNSDQHEYHPFMGIIYSDRKVFPKFINIENDIYLDLTEKNKEKNIKFTKVLEFIKSLNTDSVNFYEACTRFMESKNISEEVKRIVHSCISIED